MISTRHNFIFLHVHKTAGNAISRVLEPVSDDRIVTHRHQDGVNRFELHGPRTKAKHVPLSDYCQDLQENFRKFRICISVRHPFTRALSHYFTPGRWYRQTEDGSWHLSEPVWDEAKFLEDIGPQGRTIPAISWLDTDPPAQPDFVIRYENLAQDLNRTIQALDLPRDQIRPLEHVNQTAAPNETLQKLLASTELRDIVEERYRVDMDTFGYDSYHHTH